MVEAYPLYWPEGWKRTSFSGRTHSRFKTRFAVSCDFLVAEVKRLGGTQVVLSTNVRLRRDGLPYASEREPEDPGAAIYFLYKKNQMCFACDRYKTVKENLTAIGKTIEALRGMERWGASDMMERAFRGFLSLEDGSKRSWREVLGIAPGAPVVSADTIESSFRSRAVIHHPDRGGDQAKFQELVWARDEGRREIGVKA